MRRHAAARPTATRRPILLALLLLSSWASSAGALQSLGFVDLDAAAIAAVAPAAKVRAANGGGIIIPLFSNAGFMPFLRNLICSMKRLEVESWLVVAMDNKTCPTLLATPGLGEDSSACTFPYAKSAHAVISNTGVATYRSEAFNRMVMQRPLWVRWLLEQGYSVIQCDLDIVWLNNPIPLLRSTRLPHVRSTDKATARAAEKRAGSKPTIDYDRATLPTSRHIFSARYAASAAAEAAEAAAPGGAAQSREPWRAPDMLFQSEQAYGLNGGFYFARPTNNTLTFFAEWLRRLTEMISLPSFEEQHALNSALLRVRRTTGKLVYESLHERQFPNGKIWWSYPWLADKRSALIVHANWNKQQKKTRLMKDKLWFLADGDAQCAANFDPMHAGCSKLCLPIAYSAPGSKGPPLLKTCASLNKDDDYQARRHGSRAFNKGNGTWAGDAPRGVFWHPTAYAALNCTRNTSRVVPYAQIAHTKLMAEVWSTQPPDVGVAGQS